MIRVVPSRVHPIYVEWKHWFYVCHNNYSAEASAAKDSIERIAEHMYPDGCIVGYMIMMKDTEEMEKEELSKGEGEK